MDFPFSFAGYVNGMQVGVAQNSLSPSLQLQCIVYLSRIRGRMCWCLMYDEGYDFVQVSLSNLKQVQLWKFDRK